MSSPKSDYASVSNVTMVRSPNREKAVRHHEEELGNTARSLNIVSIVILIYTY